MSLLFPKRPTERNILENAVFTPLEPLEPRMMMTAVLDEVTGVLTITGTNGGDLIDLNSDGDGHVVVNSAPGVDDGQIFEGVRKIVIKGLGGDDFIDLNSDDFFAAGGEGRMEIKIDAGKGADTVIGSDNDDSIKGGKGDDDLFGGEGNDRIFGGEGFDNIFGGEGDDYLKGDSGNDDIDGGEGNDYGNGGSDDDFGINLEVFRNFESGK